MEALRVEGLSKDFGGVQAVHNISFQVGSGERLAIIGPNGAGKTTLFNLLCGQLYPTAGKVFLFGNDVSNMPIHRRVQLGMARSFQITHLFINLTVMQNIMLALQGTRPSRFQMIASANSYENLSDKARVLLESMGLWEKRRKRVNSISYGEKRKLEIALSFASNPKLLLLDEPSCGLTAAESTDITHRIRGLGSQMTVVLVAHDMDLIFDVAQRILVLHYGEIIAEGTCEQIRSDARVKEIYYMGSSVRAHPC